MSVEKTKVVGGAYDIPRRFRKWIKESRVGFVKFIVIIVAAIIAIGLTIRYGKDKKGNDSFGLRWWGIPAGIILLVFAFGVSSAIVQVEVGHIGVVTQFGAVTGTKLEPGLHMVTPFVQGVHVMNVQVQKAEDSAEAASQDLQDVKVTVVVNYALDPMEVVKIYSTLRDDYLSRVIDPSIQETLKATTAKFPAEELVTKREDVRGAFEAALTSRLKPYGINVNNVALTNFTFSADFTASIEAKVVAVQSALEAQNKLAQVQWEAQQAAAVAKGKADAAIAQATGERQAAILQAEGQAQAILTVANAQAQANDTLQKSITDQIIQWNQIQKLNPNVKVIVMPSGSNLILSDDALSAAAAVTK